MNPVRQAKRRDSYRKKLAAYRRSETYKLVEQRAAGRCESRIYSHEWDEVARCDSRRETGHRLTHHHLTYARFGGQELPDDIKVLCHWHNAEAEALHPTRRRGR